MAESKLPLPIDDNSKDKNKPFYVLIKKKEKITNSLCSNCKSEAIGKFLKINFEEVDHIAFNRYDFKRNFELLDLCQNCYEELKKNEYIPYFLEPLIEFSRTKDIILCLNDLDLNLEKQLLDLAQNDGVLKDKDEIDKLKTLSSLDKANLIRDLLCQELFSYNVFGDMLYILNSKGDKGDLYFVRDNLLIDAEDIIKSLLNRLFPNILTIRATEEIIPKIKEYAKKIGYNEYHEKVNPIRYIKFKNTIFDTIDFELINEVDAYFTYEIPWEIDLTFFEQLRKGFINEDYFQKCLFYQVLRRFYDDENWNKLILALGSIMLYGKNVRRRFFLIIGEPRTGKSTLKMLIENALRNYAITVSWWDIDPHNNFNFSFVVDGKRIGLLSEKPPRTIANSERLKDLLGDRIVSIVKKFKDPIRVRTHLRILAFSNEPPIFEKIDKGILDRIDVLFTQNPLEHGEIEHDLEEELLKEENIKDFLKFLLWCAYKFYLRGYLNEDEEAQNEKIKELLLESSDFTIPFVKDVCDEIKESRELRDDLYEAFKLWRKEKGLPLNIGKREFYAKMRMKYEEVVIHGDYFFKGLKIKQEYKRQDTII